MIYHVRKLLTFSLSFSLFAVLCLQNVTSICHCSIKVILYFWANLISYAIVYKLSFLFSVRHIIYSLLSNCFNFKMKKNKTEHKGKQVQNDQTWLNNIVLLSVLNCLLFSNSAIHFSKAWTCMCLWSRRTTSSENVSNLEEKKKNMIWEKNCPFLRLKKSFLRLVVYMYF